MTYLRRQRNSYNLFTTQHEKEVGGHHHDLAAISLGKTRYPMCRSLGEPHGQSWQARKISPQWDSIPPSAVSRYINCAIPNTQNVEGSFKISHNLHSSLAKEN